MNEFTAGGSFGFDAPDRILVLDTETTGLKGGLYDRDPNADPFFRRSRLDDRGGSGYDSLDWTRYGDLVVDIGICEVCLSTGEVKEVYSSIVGYDTENWPEEMLHSWIFDNSDLTVGQVSSAPRFSKVKKDIASIVKGRWLTTYNVQFDLDLFIYRFPWNLKDSFMECRDIMFSARDVCKLESPLYGVKEYRYPKLDYAYETILKGEDPAGIDGVQDHRALSDAKVASYVMTELYRNGLYDPMDFSGRHSRRE
ncbi:hypothetical protein TALC_01046 [Thermoplasmatales archaeon BRNA1]|nr:hypothetical protein TALC_01046 [Thermoplasmatales archaeon BRNA1]